MVVFCAPSQLQLQIYEQIVGAKQFKRSISAGSFHNPLPYILTLRKLCNAPSLLLRDSGKEEEGSVIYTEECQKLLKSQGMRRIEMSGEDREDVLATYARSLAHSVVPLLIDRQTRCCRQARQAGSQVHRRQDRDRFQLHKHP